MIHPSYSATLCIINLIRVRHCTCIEYQFDELLISDQVDFAVRSCYCFDEPPLFRSLGFLISETCILNYKRMNRYSYILCTFKFSNPIYNKIPVSPTSFEFYSYKLELTLSYTQNLIHESMFRSTSCSDASNLF